MKGPFLFPYRFLGYIMVDQEKQGRKDKLKMKISPKYQINQKFQEAIRNYLRDHNLNQYELGAREHVNPGMISHMHTGRLLFPLDDRRVKKIAQAIGYNGP